MILLIGYRRVTATTRALDEAGARVSRYFFVPIHHQRQFGVAVGLGLFLMNPYAVTSGSLGALRFVRTSGRSSRCFLHLPLSLWRSPRVASPPWSSVFFLVLELRHGCGRWSRRCCGSSAGVSRSRFLDRVAFWAWLWDRSRLLMATPLTVCLVVLAERLPALGSSSC